MQQLAIYFCLGELKRKRVRAHACLNGPLLQGDETWNANSGRHCTALHEIVTLRHGGRLQDFFDWEIVGVYLWAVIHDRPTVWACDAKNWPKDLWNGKLPSQPCRSRRLGTTEVQRVLALMEKRLTDGQQAGLLFFVDGKPMLVGSHSKDPDAAWGHVRRGWAKGCKLHAIYGKGCLPLCWEATPLNTAESAVAARMIPALGRGGGYILGDSGYDSNPLHDTTLATGRQLIARRKRPKAGLGHRRHSAGRLRSIALLQSKFGQTMYALRETVERQFGWLTNHGAGLAPLPNWVRRIHRVRLWMQAKLLVHCTFTRLHSKPPPLAIA